MPGSTAIAVSDLRAQIETLAADSSTDPALRVRALDETRDSLVVLLGAIDSYLGTLGKRREAEAVVGTAMVARLRENAGVREELLRRGEMTAEQLDEVGYYDSDELDRLEEEGLLEAVAGELHGRWDAARHPRGRAGQFTVSDHLASRAAGHPAPLPMPGTEPAPLPESVVQESMHIVLGNQNAGMRVNLVDPAGKRYEQMKVIDTYGQEWNPKVSVEDPDGKRIDASLLSWRAESLKPSSKRPTYSAEVKKINTQADAEAYLTSRGLEARLGTDYGTDGYRQIAQAVTDAQDRYPSLRTGRDRLQGVLDSSRVHVQDEHDNLDPGVWGTTGPDPRTTDMSRLDPATRQMRLGATYVLLNHKHQGGLMQMMDPPNALTDHLPYGRMMHELGHAVADATGWAYGDPPTDLAGYGEKIFQAFERADVSPAQLTEISPYGAANVAEAAAEVFSTINTPGAMEALTPQQRAWIRSIVEAAKTTTKEKVL